MRRKNEKKLPAPLALQDKVALTAPSSPVSHDVLKKAVDSLRFLGLNPIVMPSCEQHHGYLAGDDKTRAMDINAAFADQTIKGIFCLRGGYGAARILPLLDLGMIKRNPKTFIGYSDITALHVTFNQLCGFVTYHGPMPNTGYHNMDSFSLDSLMANLFSNKPLGKVKNPEHQPLEIIYPGKVSGLITGGNLSLLQSTLGSPYEINTKDKILFIEEVDERPYKLDKALTALALAGKFEDCAGIILGTFADCVEPEDSSDASVAGTALTLTQIFNEVIKPFKKPTLNNFRAGHIYPQSTIPMGSYASFDTNKDFIEFQM